MSDSYNAKVSALASQIVSSSDGTIYWRDAVDEAQRRINEELAARVRELEAAVRWVAERTESAGYGWLADWHSNHPIVRELLEGDKP